MMDYHTRQRRLWLELMGRRVRKFCYVLFGSRNQHGIDREEFSWRISDRSALVICAVIFLCALWEAVK